MAREMPQNSEKQKCYFSREDWTTQIGLMRLANSAFWRSGFWTGKTVPTRSAEIDFARRANQVRRCRPTGNQTFNPCQACSVIWLARFEIAQIAVRALEEIVHTFHDALNVRKIDRLVRQQDRRAVLVF
jgi:hypothetical protein